MLTWLCSEITEAGGRAVLWACASLSQGQDESLQALFLAQVDSGYEGILSRLDAGETDLEGIARDYLRLCQTDYLGSRKGREVRRRLEAMRNGMTAEEGGST